MCRDSAASPDLPTLGVGITYSVAIEPLLERAPDLFDVVEIEPQTTWIKEPGAIPTYRVREATLTHIESLPGRKLVHSIGTPVGGSVRPEPAQLELLAETIGRLDAPWASDHLSFNATPEFATGFFLPPRQTAAGLDTVAQAIGDLQIALPVPVAVETGVNYLRPRADELSDGSFVAAVVDRADCGLLLDLHNVYANALNGRQALDEYLDELPLERVWELHIAGGMELDGFWLDAHSGAIPDPLLASAARLLPRLPNLRAIVFEIFPSFVPVVGLELIEEQLERLHALWDEPRTPPSAARSGLALVQPRHEAVCSDVGPPEWEETIGRLATGLPASGALATELADDPGVRVVAGLVREFRASMVVGVLRLTSRLLLLALGPDVFRTLLNDFWSRTPPEQYAALEAEAFVAYLADLDLAVPQLGEVLEFERAVVATLCDDKPRVVRFERDPLPLLRSLAEGALPDRKGTAGTFEIEITPDGPASARGLAIETLEEAFPYH